MQLLEKSLKGLKRLKGETKRDRRPITLTELVCLHNALRPQFTDTLEDTMLWAAFTLAFFGFLRCSEFTCNSSFDPECHLSRNASHSFRIGAATAAGSAGLPTWLIKTLGRWSSDCYERYIRTPKDVLVSVPCQLTANVSY